jgi:hypothetical protein
MGCNSKINTLNALRDKGIINDKRAIPSDQLNEFNRLNEVYTKAAKEIYGVSTEENLFKVNRKKHATTGQTIYRAIPNEEVFEAIDKAIALEEYRIMDEEDSLDYYEDFEALPSDVIPNYEKYINYKKLLKSKLEHRLNKVKADKKKFASDPQKLKELTKLQNELTERIEGSEEKGLTGLNEEIATLESGAALDKLNFYAERDISRLSKLAKSTNEQDLAEARNIIRFYTAIGTFETKSTHPLFANEDIFNADGILILDPQIVKDLQALKDRVQDYENQIYQKEKTAIEDAVNNNRKIQQTFEDKEFNYDELFFKDGGLKDASWIDMFVMDITNGIYSHNGIIPQVMMNVMQNAFEDHLVYAKSVEERVSEIQDQVESELRKMGYGIKMPGIKGVSYDIFRATNKDGQFQDGVTQRYTSEFAEAKSKMNYNFNKKIKEAQQEENPEKRAALFTEAYKTRENWYRKHTIVLDPRRIPELMKHESMKKYSDLFAEKDSEAYVAKLKETLGEQGYKEEIEKQLKLLKEYETMLEVYTDNIIAEEGVEDYNKLSEAGVRKIKSWEKRNSPFEMIESYRNGKPITQGKRKVYSTMQYNYSVPRKFQTKVSLEKGVVKVTDTETPSGYYDERFEIIESNKVLKEFHSLLMEVNQKIFETLPPEMRNKFSANSIPALQKSLIEILFDPNATLFQRISKAARELYDRIRALFGMNVQANLSYAPVDPITGKPEYRINSEFLKGNKGIINERYKQELLRFKYAQKLSGTESVGKFDTFDLTTMSPEALAVIAENLGVAPTIEAIKKRLPTADVKAFEVGKFLKAGITHQIVAENSMDLPKILKLYSYLSMEYAARQEVLPFLEMTKRHYEEIKSPSTTNTGAGVVNAGNRETRLEGYRTRANRQMNSWFNRVVLGDYSSKEMLDDPRVKRALDIGKTGSDKIDNLTKKFRPKIKGKIYTADEKELKAKLEKTLENLNNELSGTEEGSVSERHLMTLKKNTEKGLDNLGKTLSRTAFIDAIFNFIRLKGLGWNLSSGVTNFMEGQISNFTIAATGDYFKPENIYAANAIIKESFLKNATFGKVATGRAKKTSVLMERYRILQDASNELQKASTKSAFTKTEMIAPYTLTQRVEFLNQAPLMVAKLMDVEITGKDGSTNSVWDAMNSDGTLKENFATEENKKNWEEASGDMYQDFASSMKKMIVNAHGDYDELRGNLATEYAGGKALLMFKRWMARQFYQRFARPENQHDIEVGIKDYKGRYRSHTNATGFLHGAIVGATVLGPLGAIGGGLGGAAFANFFGNRSEIGFVQEMAFNLKELALTMLRMPVNSLMGKPLIKHSDYQKFIDAGMSERDIRNMRANMVDMAVMLGFLALLLFTKALLWDDEDDEDDTRRRLHNLLANRAMQLSGQATMYTNPIEIADNTLAGSELSAIRFVSDTYKFAENVVEVMSGGEDTYTSGPYAGESKIGRSFSKAFLPSFIRPGFGFESQMKKQYEKSFYDDWFKGAETKAEESTKAIRAEYRAELRENGIAEDEVNKEVNKRYPSKKENQSYEELLEQYEGLE